MTDTRGTFKLRNVRQNILNDEYVPFSEVYLKDNDVGHFRDGNPSGPLSRTNLGTELTAYAPGITNITRWSAGSSCQTHAFFAGGASSGATSPPALSSTYKLTYSSYTSAQAPAAPLPTPKAISIGVASEDNAYINSGYEGGGSPSGQTGTCKISFATDTTTNLPSANIAAINWEMQSLTDGAGGGYLFGGTWVPGQASIGSRCYKITYSTDGLAQLPGSNTTWNPVETNRNPETSRASMMNRTAGYQSGGNSFPGSGGSSMTTKLTYSSLAWSVVPGAYLPDPRRKAASGTGNSKAWYGCGSNPSSSNFTLLDFSAETWSAVPGMNHPGPSGSGSDSANSSTSPRDSLKGADKASRGYDGGKGKRWYDDAASSTFGGGSGVDFDGSGDYLTTSRAYVDMSTPFCVEAYVKWDTMGTPSNMGMIFSQYEAGQNGRLLVGAQNTNNCVVRWNGGGVKLETGTDSITTGTWYHVAWTFDGSNTGNVISGTHRLFLDGQLRDTCTSSDMSVVYTGTELEIGGQATLGGYSIDGKISNLRVVQGDVVYNQSGFTPPTGEIANIAGTRLLCCQSDSSVTAATVSDGPITSAGDPTVFTNDQTLPINKAPNVTPTASTAFFPHPGLSNNGYLLTGSPSTNYYKISYATDVFSGLPAYGVGSSPSPNIKRTYNTSASSDTDGYFAGGRVGPGLPDGGSFTWVDKFTYSNETAAAMPSSGMLRSWPSRFPGSYTGAMRVGAGNLQKCYWIAGGDNPAPNIGSQTDKLTFSNGTCAYCPSADAGQVVRKLQAVGAPTEVYFGGGSWPAATPSYNYDKLYKISYSNDTMTSIPGVTTNMSGIYNGATGNSRFGLFTNQGTDMMKFTYSTETWLANYAFRSYNINSAAATGNEENGYQLMGKNPGGGSNASKISYTTDLVSLVPASPGNEPNYGVSATGARDDAHAGSIAPVNI